MNKRLLLALFCFAVPVQVAFAQPDCVAKAAQHYHIPHEILNAVLSVEGGAPGMRVYNNNGSYDIGPMQINSIWLPELSRRGISEEALTNDYCTNVLVGAWILGRELKRAGAPMNTPEFWKAVGRYNSRTPNHNVNYAVRVWKRAKLLRQKSR
ncbi:MAG: lytic transglycosylase domain-containing protein [Gallionella sp.]|nr:lytic transglycosylase domain-containing protein [Gallionella sp.]